MTTSILKAGPAASGLRCVSIGMSCDEAAAQRGPWAFNKMSVTAMGHNSGTIVNIQKAFKNWLQ